MSSKCICFSTDQFYIGMHIGALNRYQRLCSFAVLQPDILQDRLFTVGQFYPLFFSLTENDMQCFEPCWGARLSTGKVLKSDVKKPD